MARVGGLTVRQPGELADQLLACLRAKALEHQIGIEAGKTGMLFVDDLNGHADDLPGFLQRQLDACGAALGVNWREYISVAH
jgi:hypothetical protein